MMRDAGALRRTADAIETADPSDLRFDMFLWGCRTAACIAGFAVFAHDRDEYHRLRQNTYDIMGRAGEILGLSASEKSSLFVPWGMEKVTVDMAVGYLRYLASNPDAGVTLDWPLTFR